MYITILIRTIILNMYKFPLEEEDIMKYENYCKNMSRIPVYSVYINRGKNSLIIKLYHQLNLFLKNKYFHVN